MPPLLLSTIEQQTITARAHWRLMEFAQSELFALDCYLTLDSSKPLSFQKSSEFFTASAKLEVSHVFGHSSVVLWRVYAPLSRTRRQPMPLCNSDVGMGEDWRVMERAVMVWTGAMAEPEASRIECCDRSRKIYESRV
jgi:hypothetical protein